MISFFRKIRQNMLNEGKTVRYFKYAIGEILLVVIGILIALQINNWNENKKSTVQEIIILKNLQEDIKLDMLDINFNLKLHNLFLENELALLSFLQSDLEHPLNPIDYTNALSFSLAAVMHQSTFTNLINNDIGIITNNELKTEIYRFYDFFVVATQMVENNIDDYQSYSVKKPYFLKYFKLAQQIDMIPLGSENSKVHYNPNLEKQGLIFANIQEAKSDEAFKIDLNESIFHRRAKLGIYDNLVTKISELSESIDKELHKLSQ